MPIYNAALKYLDLEETKRYAGLSKGNFSEQEIQRACTEAQMISRPQGVWELYDFESLTGKINSAPIYYIEGNSIRRHLRNADKVLVFALTLGYEIEQAITQYFQAGNYAYALLLDAAATTAVETAADELEKAAAPNLRKQGYQLLARFSPGYGDWDIHFQPQMLSLAGAKKIGIQLTESYMLTPRKSITAVIGLIPRQENTQVLKHDCANCNKIDCLARRENEL